MVAHEPRYLGGVRVGDNAVIASSRSRVLDFWAFFLPALSFLEITLVGRLFVTEILAVTMLPWLMTMRDRPLVPKWFVALWAGWLISQILTDILVGSSFEDLARGWAAIGFTLTNFVAILILVSTPRRARLFALGLAVAGVLGYLYSPNEYAAFDPWKWAFALPVGYLIATMLSGRLGGRLRWLAVVTFVAFGALNLVLGFRSLGGVSLLTGGYLFMTLVFGRRRTVFAGSPLRATVGVTFLAVAVLIVLDLYTAVASQGLLGPEAQAKYSAQTGAFGVLVGGRPELLVSTQAVLDSPILGHGSWARDFAYVDLLTARRTSLGYEAGPDYSEIGLIPAHSFLMGSWVWAGLMGGLFWSVILAVAVWLLAHLYSYRMNMSPLLVFSTMLLLWDIAFSPYGLNERLIAPYAIVLCLLGLRLLRSEEGASLPRRIDDITWPGTGSKAGRLTDPRGGSRGLASVQQSGGE